MDGRDLELAAYRIVQESVTNVVRHAGTRCCQVLIADDGEAVSIDVADHGQSRATARQVPDAAWPGCASGPSC